MWLADIGDLIGWGKVTERLEFLGDGTVMSDKGPATYIGNYQLLDNNRIRIDWKEQGLFGHAPTQIFRYDFGNDSLMLYEVNSDVYQVYLREDEYARRMELLRVRLGERKQGVVSLQAASDILGSWEEIKTTCEEGDVYGEGEFYETSGRLLRFTEDAIIWENNYNVDYLLLEEDLLMVLGEPGCSLGSKPLKYYYFSFKLSAKTLLINDFSCGCDVEFARR